MFEEIKALLAENLQIDADTITPDAQLVNDLGINSLELADLVLLCEEKYNIDFKDDDIHKLITVGDIVDYISNLAK